MCNIYHRAVIICLSTFLSSCPIFVRNEKTITSTPFLCRKILGKSQIKIKRGNLFKWCSWHTWVIWLSVHCLSTVKTLLTHHGFYRPLRCLLLKRPSPHQRDPVWIRKMYAPSPPLISSGVSRGEGLTLTPPCFAAWTACQIATLSLRAASRGNSTETQIPWTNQTVSSIPFNIESWAHFLFQVEFCQKNENSLQGLVRKACSTPSLAQC